MNTAHSSSDHQITTARGHLFARCWPAAANVDGQRAAPIVLFHDSLGCIELWRGFPALLAAQTGRSVIAYDRLGFGQSDPRSGGLAADFVQAEAATGFLALQDHFGFERFIALGHSVGGGMAVHCAARYADACDGLITVSAQAFVEDKTLAGISEAQAQFRLPEPFARLQRYHGDKARWVLDAWIDTWLAPAFRDWSLHEVLPQVTCPTLVLHGSEDEYGSSRHPQQIAGMVGGAAQLELLAGVRHVPHKEQEDWVVGRIARFLANGMA